MSATLISGKEISSQLRLNLKKKVDILKEKDIIPKLVVILVGNNPASLSYVKGKEKAALEIGISSYTHRLDSSLSEEELLALIQKYNQDKSVHGILVQLPLPSHISETKVIDTIDPTKDVDGFHPISIGKMMLGQDCFLPCTPHGVMKMLEHIDFSVSGKHVVVLGRSNIVGKPIANMLLNRGKYGDATVTICHSRTPDIKKYTLQADVIICAVGKPNLLTADMVKPGVVIIDVAVNRIEDSSSEKGFRLVGDADFDALKEKASAISPVPGGVGPMTITMLMENTIKAAGEAVDSF